MPRITVSPTTHNMDNPICPLCGQGADIGRTHHPPDRYQGFCERCGDICILRLAVEEADRQGKKYLISAWLRRNPRVAGDLIGLDTVERILRDTPDYDVLEKLDLTLSEISRLTAEPGQRSTFRSDRDYPLVYAHSENEAAFYVKQLAEMGYSAQDYAIAQVTAKGYQRLREIQRAGRQSAFAFVAMWFDPSMNEIYDSAIQPAIEEAGYKAVRIDREQHANRIDDEIIGRIKGSRFMVADFSGQRAGVYFESGMMLGLGRTVIWMCRNQEMKDVHFDTRQYNCIDYASTPEAKKRLLDRILAIEGEGPNGTDS